ncbi:hypothetical protein NHH03_10080 [Stieleria sp. TO1_6]|uniref:hypothetical protein n=1 Tax=Stieleria tagensis TaxID=2956795 RepID=UPI00209B7035|nr:hypothetical protein [Stieleria tagensis]MCO8122086.1 hypothetical protein [Stieleria tagensis]
MAKQSEDREDLFRDGTGMPIRGRFWIDESEIVIGFRRDGQPSLYWDQDPVFQFDADSRLRRVFLDSVRYKVDAGQLLRLVQSGDDGVESSTQRLKLVAQPLTKTEVDEVQKRLAGCLQGIDRFLQAYKGIDQLTLVETTGEPPGEFIDRVKQWRATVSIPVEFADGPSA